MHFISASDLVALGFFDSYTTAAVWCAQARLSGKMRAVGMYHEKGKRGPMEFQYLNGWWPKSDNYRHERQASDVCFQFWPYARFRRGPFVDERLADVEVTLEYPENEYHFYIEVDCGSHGRVKFQRRARKFTKCETDVYFVVSDKHGRDEWRLEQIRDWWTTAFRTRRGDEEHPIPAPPIGHFTMMKSFVADPFGLIWDHWDGQEWTKTGIDDPEPFADSVQVGSPEEATASVVGE